MKTIFLAFSIRNSSVSDYFIQLANQLSVKYKVVIIADHISSHPFLISSDITILKWPSNRQIKFKNFIFLVQLIRKYRPTMMISNFTSVNFFLIAGFLFRVKNRIAWCHSVSGAFYLKTPLINRKKYIYKLATVIVANSIATKDDLIKNFSVKASRIQIFYNAIRNYCPVNLKFDPNQIIYVGRMDKSKGVDVLLNALPDVLKINPSLKLHLIGGNLQSRQIQEFKKQAELLNIDSNVFFLGHKPKDFVMEEFSKSNLTIVPSYLEGFGYVVIESFSVKTPVIGSNSTGIAEIIRNGKDGFLFKTGDSKDLSDKILKVIQDKNLRNDLSKNCFNRFKEEFELNSRMNKIFHTLDGLMN